jgi:hypothetical protein
MIYKENIMTFQPGQSGNPKGRPTGAKASKSLAIETVFEIMAEHKDKFKEKLIEEANKDIIKFYKQFVAPLQPRELSIETTRVSEIICLELLDGTRREYGEAELLQSPQIPAPSSN